MSELDKFFQKINNLLKEEKLLKEERMKRGELFNIFQVMHMEADEVYTHSAFIAHLLDPQGSHGCGNTFLKLFIETISDLQGLNFDLVNPIKVKVEESIGTISNKNDTGGRLDIIITDHNNNAIIIENKIYAGDQKGQLHRYYNYAQTHHKEKYKLLYLTLDGHEPSEDSTGGKLEIKKDYDCISYASEIKLWITLCIEKSSQRPLVRETLVQYLKLITRLTHQDMETNTENKLKDLCKDPENINALFWIYENFASVINTVMNEKFKPQLIELASRKKLKINFKSDDWFNTNYMEFMFLDDNWTTFGITFQFQRKGLKECVCGFKYRDGKMYKTNLELYGKIYEHFMDHKHSDGWPAYKYLDAKYKDWTTKVGIEMINNGKFIEYIEQCLNYYLEYTKETSI
jgi:hypothetical protein